MELISGYLEKAQKIVIYGVEGIGKTTLASKFPNPLFIDTEDSTAKMNVHRTKKPTSWAMLLDQIKEIIQQDGVIGGMQFSTLIIDTADWAERLCAENVCTTRGKNGIEDFGYGNGYVYVEEEWGKFLNLLQDVIDVAKLNVVLNAHSIIRKFELPNEMGSYDKYEMKLGKKTTARTAPLTKEWADMVFFLNYKTYSVSVDDKGKKHKAQGGQRVMYTTHHPCWDAKNRDGLPEELPLDYAGIAHVIKDFKHRSKVSVDEERTVLKTPIDDASIVNDFITQPDDGIVSKDDIDAMNSGWEDLSKLPKGLSDLMKMHHITKSEIENVVQSKGYYPSATPIENYDPDFIQGVLIGAWDSVFKAIVESRNSGLPF